MIQGEHLGVVNRGDDYRVRRSVWKTSESLMDAWSVCWLRGTRWSAMILFSSSSSSLRTFRGAVI